MAKSTTYAVPSVHSDTARRLTIEWDTANYSEDEGAPQRTVFVRAFDDADEEVLCITVPAADLLIAAASALRDTEQRQ